MRIVHTALYTDKFEETVNFYENVFDAENLGIFTLANKGCWIKLGDTILEIFESEKLVAEGAFKHIAIECEDVDALFAKALNHGAVSYVEPKDTFLKLAIPRHLRIAFIKGINNEQIELLAYVGSLPF